MLLIALKMLVRDRTKYLGIVLGLSFASFIISQQAAILVGIVDRTFGFITDTSQPTIWVTDPTVQFIDDVKPLKDTVCIACVVFRVLRGLFPFIGVDSGPPAHWDLSDVYFAWY